MAYVGGLRERLIRESLYRMVEQALDDLGWFDPSRPHEPIMLRSAPYPNDVEIPFNTVIIHDDNASAEGVEIGSDLGEERWVIFIDVYAEDDALGLHLSSDIRDILRGKIHAIGRSAPNFEVYDYTMATPPIIFWCEIENVERDRANNFPNPWQQHWYAVTLDVVDYYESDLD